MPVWYTSVCPFVRFISKENKPGSDSPRAPRLMERFQDELEEVPAASRTKVQSATIVREIFFSL